MKEKKDYDGLPFRDKIGYNLARAMLYNTLGISQTMVKDDGSAKQMFINSEEHCYEVGKLIDSEIKKYTLSKNREIKGE